MRRKKRDLQNPLLRIENPINLIFRKACIRAGIDDRGFVYGSFRPTRPRNTGAEQGHDSRPAWRLGSRRAAQYTTTIPFSKRELILSIDPFLPQAIEDGLSTTLDQLVENGYIQFVVNNPGHIGMLRNRGLKLIAGPYLYTFNRWAVDWLNKQGLYSLVTPIENSRDNLEATFDPKYRDQVFITIFAWPALFRMRFRLPADYNFNFVFDRQGGVFKTLSTDDGSFVLPENPFSIADKSSAIKKTGFSRFLVDLSKTKLKKQEYRIIMDSYRKGTMIPDVSRFNWKDGFYDPDRIEELRQMTERANFRKVDKKGPFVRGDKLNGGKPRGDKPAGDKAHADKPFGDKTGDKIRSGKPRGGRDGSETRTTRAKSTAGTRTPREKSGSARKKPGTEGKSRTR